MRQKRLKPQGYQVRPAPSSRTRSGALEKEKEKPAMKQSLPGPMGDLLTVLVIRKMQTFHFKAQWACVLRARQGANTSTLSHRLPACCPTWAPKASQCLPGPASSLVFAPLAHTSQEAAATGVPASPEPLSRGSSINRAQEGRVQCYVHFALKQKQKQK